MMAVILGELEETVEKDVPRFSRHVLLRVMGEHGQERIARSKVLVAGLGALGSLIADLLARAGVGFLRIVDMDAPELHNLHRQLLYDESDVVAGLSKPEAAKRRLQAACSSVEIEAVQTVIGPDNAWALTDGVDLVVDALDNATARFPINDAIVERRIPYVFGGAVETVGNVMTIIPGETPCLRCLWPDPAAVADHARASTVGVLSSAATAVASVEVTEAVKILVGRRENILRGLLVMDFWNNMYHEAHVEPDPNCRCRK